MHRNWVYSMPPSRRKTANRANGKKHKARATNTATSDVALQMAASSDQVQPMEIDGGLSGGASLARECHCFPSQLLDPLTFLPLYSMPVAIPSYLWLRSSRTDEERWTQAVCTRARNLSYLRYRPLSDHGRTYEDVGSVVRLVASRLSYPTVSPALIDSDRWGA